MKEPNILDPEWLYTRRRGAWAVLYGPCARAPIRASGTIICQLYHFLSAKRGGGVLGETRGPSRELNTK